MATSHTPNTMSTINDGSNYTAMADPSRESNGLQFPSPDLPAWPGDQTGLSTVSSSSSVAPWGPLDLFLQDPNYLAYQEELRCLIFQATNSSAPTPGGTPAASPPPGTGTRVSALSTTAATTTAFATHVSPALSPQFPADVLTRGRRLEYLENYVSDVAPWLDMFDSSRAFGIQMPMLARTSLALLYAILALSARQIERKESRQVFFDSLELYQEAIQLLAPLLQAHDQEVIPICTVLCVMEMMSISPRDWRRHLEGCAALFGAFGVHGFCGGLLQAVFWCYARMDVCSALISDGTQSTLVPPSKWLAPDANEARPCHLFLQTENPDMYANCAVYLCSKVCDLIASRTRHIELGEMNGCSSAVYAERWLDLWQNLQAWIDTRPAVMLPVEVVNSSPFPHILFIHWSAISSTQLYHTACILLLQMIPKTIHIEAESVASPVWHAKRICGISLTNPHQGCLNNAIQPLWVAGRLLTHKLEHDIITKLIREIEATTGWGTCWRIHDLRAEWGYQDPKR